MDITIKKFIKYLEQRFCEMAIEIRKNYDQNLAKQINPTKFDDTKIKKDYPFNKDCEFLYKFLEFIKNPEEKYNQTRFIFTEYDRLSPFLIDSPLNNQEKFNIIKYILELNILKFPDNDALIIPNEEIIKLKFKDMSDDEYHEFITGKAFADLLTKNQEDLTDQEKEYITKLYEAVKNQKVKTNYEIAYRLIKKHYFDKIANLSDVDIEITIRSIKIIGVDSSLCEPFKYLLLKEREANKAKKVSLKQVKKTECQNQDEPKRLSQKEYDKIFREIEKHYDIQNQRVIKPLLLEEIIYIVSLMYKINISEKEIVKCIQTINKEGLDAYHNPLSYFNAYYAKMLSCSDNPDISNALQTILEYLQEIYVPDSKEDYSFWKYEIEKELKTVIPIINKNYQYELEAGKKL